jgi:hypothetical protein
VSPQNSRVSDGDKRRARDIVERALSEGRIIQADRDMRMSQIDNAQSVDELRMLTHDLDRSAMFGGAIDPPSPAAPPPPPPPPPPAPTATPPTTPTGSPPNAASTETSGFQPVFQAGFGNVPYGSSPSMIADEALEGIKAAAGTTAKSAGRSCLGCLIPLVILIVVFAVPAVFFIHDIKGVWDDVQDSLDSASQGPNTGGTDSPEKKPDVLSVNGWNDLEAGVKAATGRTEVFMVVAYPTYASVTATVDATSNRSQTLYWDGSFSGPGTTGTNTEGRIDMADVKGETIVKLIAKAKKLVHNPTSWYVVVEAPVFENASILTFASNEAGDTSTIFATAAGKVVNVTRP